MIGEAWRYLAFLGDQKVELRTRPIPSPGPRQVLTRTAFSQVSAGSEMNTFRNRSADGEPRPGGYTAVGWVEQIGAAVEGVQTGERVLFAGHHADYHIVDVDDPTWRRVLQPIPDDHSFQRATFAILGDVALHGVRRARLQIDQSVAVFGLGVVGQLVARLARLSGAYPVIGIDPIAGRRALAERSGATITLDPRVADVAEAVRQNTGGRGAEAVFHATGSPRVLVDCMRCAAPRSPIILIGSAPGTVEIGLQVELLRRELTILGSYEAGLEGEPHPYWSWTRDRNRATIFRLIQHGELHVDHLISHVVEPEQAPGIYELLAAGGERCMSVLFRWS